MDRDRMLHASASASSSSTRLPPPLYWNVSDSQKNGRDYITENMQHVRQVSNQARKSRSKEGLEPLKAKFIPGLTKNPKYEHVESRISGLIQGTTKFGPDSGTRLNNSNSSTSLTSKLNGTNGKGQDAKPIWGASTAANARRIKSTTDLRKSSSSIVAHRRPVNLKPQEESVYNWQFQDHRPRDNLANGDEFGMTEHQQTTSDRGPVTSRSSRMTQTMSWPTDDGAGDFVRSNLESMHGFNMQAHDSTENLSQLANGNSTSLQALNKDTNGSTVDFAKASSGPTQPYLNRQINASALSSSKSRTIQAPTNDSYPSPHKTGTIPKYLKKRQQQWKEDEIARKEAEKAASIPPGHVAMTEVERQENLSKLQNTYDSLVNELNRIPISIDTIRVRQYKQNLEQELCKLEQAMKLFSRPQVYIKI